ncbi:MAG: hypothetical protein B7Z66_14620 [Chromatiales bacterium 21-64-14]|nr:MAG: hypothetical protein B7Z66_14620 [Chromatiales bacterium 21-64-14]HQU17283.1 hypothetical protein [Gammaproteobacteria bacterium]
MAWFNDAIFIRKASLAQRLERPMSEIATRCVAYWSDTDYLDGLLKEALPALPQCQLLYALDASGMQVSSNVSGSGLEPQCRGRDLSSRPYLAGSLPFQGFGISHAYANTLATDPCVTALQAVTHTDGVLGFIAADFDVKTLPVVPPSDETSTDWRQYRGDPAIRGTLFQQRRVPSAMDEHMDEVLTLFDRLIREHGVFHSKLHLSSSRAVLWLLHDPYHYRLHELPELIDPRICLPYPRHPYPEQATVPPEQIRPVLERFRVLRHTDETLYLRSASLNIMNGLVRLTFSCDGSHYMPVDEFLRRDTGFWFG